MIRAADLLADACRKHGIDLAILVAEASLWAHPDVHRTLARKPDGPCWYPNRRRYKAGQGEKKGQRLGDVYLDDNSYANVAIKQACGFRKGELEGFEVCHIWPGTAYDVRYHTCIANMVLLPRPLAGLSDHDERIQAVLQFRSFDIYGWHPEELPRPERPDGYPENWRPPEAYPSRASRLKV